jgi:maltoporin
MLRRFSSNSLASVLAIGLPIAIAVSAGRAHAQAAEPTPANPPPPAVAEASPIAEQQLEQIRKMVSAMPKLFEFDGYFRAGFGINAKGGDQDAFQAPGAYSKYRLGNEIETYGEIGLTANWINPDHSDTWFKTKIKLAIVAPRNSTFDTLNAIAVREAYGEAGHVLEAHPEMTFWAGQRFYRRRDVHIIDFFFNDLSGYGAGFQDMKVGDKMKLSVAYLGGSVDATGGGGSDVGRLTKNIFDIRLSDIPVGNGNLEVMLLPTFGAQGSGTTRNLGGLGGGVFYFVPMMGGFNEVSAQLGYRGIANLSTFVDNSLAKDGWLFRAVDRAVFQLNPQLSMMATAVLQFDNRDGSPAGSTDSGVGNTWFSIGARPVYNFTKYTAIAVEGGIDIVKPQGEPAPGASNTGVLAKLTVAPLIRPGMDFWARPELRAFVTVAAWNDAIRGAVGGPAFSPPGCLASDTCDTAGLTVGVQAESWW